MIFREGFWRACFIRALRTFIQGIVGVWGTGMLITDIKWQDTLLMAGSMAILSILTSMLLGLPEVDDDILAGSGNIPENDAQTHELYDPEDVEVCDGNWQADN